MSETVVLLGDAHLGHARRESAARLHAFLDAVPRAGDHLVITGDLFDFWFEYRSVIPRSAFPTLAALSGARARGVRLTLVGGNHDRWGGDFWRQEVGAEFHAAGRPGIGRVPLARGPWRRRQRRHSPGSSGAPRGPLPGDVRSRAPDTSGSGLLGHSSVLGATRRSHPEPGRAGSRRRAPGRAGARAARERLRR
ncbi:MAG: metallophosphoesterase [Gemmatimonadetes bacterium]|nr:metallophosphoesterase [Gemmatimonadota bacterium]